MNEGAKSNRSKGYPVALLLLIGFAALSNATKELGRLHEFVSDMHSVVASWSSSGLSTVSAAGISTSEFACADSATQRTNGQDFRWHGRIATGKSIEIRGLHGDVLAEPASGDEVEVVASKTSKTSDVNVVTIKVVEHEDGVTICAVYPTDDPNRFTPCRPARLSSLSDMENSLPEAEVQNNDVHVNFKVRVPAGVDFLARTITGEISAESMASNISAKSVNGNIRVSTSGYANAKTVNGEISAKLGNGNWPGSLDFKTVNGEISLELPASLNADVNVKTFHGDISSDFPLNMTTSKISKKHFSGTIGTGGRQLNLKTLNGSITLRRIG